MTDGWCESCHKYPAVWEINFHDGNGVFRVCLGCAQTAPLSSGTTVTPVTR